MCQVVQNLQAQLAMGPHLPPSVEGGGRGQQRPAKPSKFRGDREDPVDAETWLFSLSLSFDANGTTTDIARIAFAAAMLDKHALTWWRAVLQAAAVGGPPAPATWVAFCSALAARFQPPNSKRVARDRLLILRQATSVAQYAARMQQLLLECPDIGPEDQKHRFVSGLKPHIKRELMLREPRDLTEAIEMAERVDSVVYTSTPRFPAMSVRTGPMPMELGAMQKSDSEEAGDGWDQHNLELQYEELHERLNALGLQLGRHPGDRAAPRTPPSAAARPAMAGWRSPPLRTPMTAEQRADAIARGLCFRCLKPGHCSLECPKRAALSRPKGGAPQA